MLTGGHFSFLITIEAEAEVLASHFYLYQFRFDPGFFRQRSCPDFVWSLIAPITMLCPLPRSHVSGFEDSIFFHFILYLYFDICYGNLLL